jgi:hypothetical protein
MAELSMLFHVGKHPYLETEMEDFPALEVHSGRRRANRHDRAGLSEDSFLGDPSWACSVGWQEVVPPA